MGVLYLSSNNGVVMTVNAAGLKKLRRHLDYQDQLAQAGMDPTEASARASHRYPYPPMITFTTQESMPMRSDNGLYGHGGTMQLLEALIEVGNHVVHRDETFPVFNSNQLDLPVPTTEDFVKIFGRSARRLVRGN